MTQEEMIHWAADNPLDVEVVADTPYDPTGYQGTLFCADNLLSVFADCACWLALAAS